jgi:hypothetical protein
MDHGLMTGMLLGGILLSVIPLIVGVALGVLAVRHYREERRAEGSRARK